MGFLAPVILAALGALAVPVVIHLIQRDRRQVIPFPSLMFLQRIPYRSFRRRRIRNWLLLLVRAAALALLVLAFARPFVGQVDVAAVGTGGAREIVILLDNSYSMAAEDRWNEARAAARGMLDGLAPEDRVSLVVFARNAAAVVSSTPDRAQVVGALDRATVSDEVTRYGPALKLAAGLLGASQRPRREAVLITDFQRTGWAGAENVKLPPGATLQTIPVGEESVADLMVAGATFDRQPIEGGERVTVTARLVNRGTGRDDVPVTLTVDGTELETRTVSVEPAGSATVAFAPIILSRPHTRGRIATASDALPVNDALFFTLSPGGAVPVLLVEPARPGTASLYVRRALAIGGNPGFDVAVRAVSDVSADDLPARGLVVLNDAVPSGAFLAALQRFAEGGGGVLLALGERTSGEPIPDQLLPGQSTADVVDLGGSRGGTLGYVDYSHPAFELFGAPRSGDLTAARVFRYRRLTPAEGLTVAARFDDGAPALAERRVGEGLVMVWTSTLDTFWNDLALAPVFLPFVHQVGRHLAGYRPAPPFWTTGDVLDVKSLDAAGLDTGDGAERIALAPSGTRTPIEAGREAVVLEQQGFYEIRRTDDTEDRPPTVAVNVDPAESDLARVDPQEMSAALTTAGGEGTTAEEGAQSFTVQDLEARQSMWRYLLVAALLLLVAETLLSNRLSRRPAPQ